MTAFRSAGFALLLFICLAHSSPLKDRTQKSTPDGIRLNRERRGTNGFFGFDRLNLSNLNSSRWDRESSQQLLEEMVVSSMTLVPDTNDTSVTHQRSAVHPRVPLSLPEEQ